MPIHKTNVFSAMSFKPIAKTNTRHYQAVYCRSDSQRLEYRRLSKRRAATVDVHGSENLEDSSLNFKGIHHVGLLCKDIEVSVKFYKDMLDLEINPNRPDNKLPYRGAWFWIGDEMIHLMELPNPDPMENRPQHGGRDRHFCVSIEDLDPLVERLEAANVEYTQSKSGRRAVFFRDPDMNCIEVFEAKMSN